MGNDTGRSNRQIQLQQTLDMVRSLSINSRIKKYGRNFADFLADRIMQATTEPSLTAAIERLSKLLDSDPGKVSGVVLVGFLQDASSSGSQAVLHWLRGYPRVAAMLCMLKQTDYMDLVQTIEVKDMEAWGSALPDPGHEINLKFTCLSPIAHGSDTKAGNAMLFRRMQVLTTEGNVISMPYYAGNAIRGQMRDLLADDFVRALGLIPRRDRPPLTLWFFHALYAGGALEGNSSADKALKQMIGASGVMKAHGIYQFRNMLPALSLLGCAMGSRILSGRVRFGDLRPECREWGNGGIPVGELFEWIYLTRREDHDEHEEHHGMVANTECLRAGTILCGGLDLDMHATPLERSALGHGLQLLSEVGYIGAGNRRGLGRVKIEYDNSPDPKPYVAFLEENRDAIIGYLNELGAINARGNADSEVPV